MYASKDIIDNAVNSKDHTTLVAAVKAAGLVETLKGPGPFTVFAPTNAAFAALPAGTVDNLLKPENKAALTKVLTYHVVPGKVMAGDLTGFPPATPQAVMEILGFYGIPMKGQEAVIIGRSMVVGKPNAMLLLNENATVTICHSKTRDLPGVCRRADILIAAIGKAKMITADYIKPGATVIDVGINVEGDKLYGDVDTEAAKAVAGAITPVPGGVGAVTTRVLLKHVLKAAKLQNP